MRAPVYVRGLGTRSSSKHKNNPSLEKNMSDNANLPFVTLNFEYVPHRDKDYHVQPIRRSMNLPGTSEEYSIVRTNPLPGLYEVRVVHQTTERELAHFRTLDCESLFVYLEDSDTQKRAADMQLHRLGLACLSLEFDKVSEELRKLQEAVNAAMQPPPNTGDKQPSFWKRLKSPRN